VSCHLRSVIGTNASKKRVSCHQRPVSGTNVSKNRVSCHQRPVIGTNASKNRVSCHLQTHSLAQSLYSVDESSKSSPSSSLISSPLSSCSTSPSGSCGSVTSVSSLSSHAPSRSIVDIAPVANSFFIVIEITPVKWLYIIYSLWNKFTLHVLKFGTAVWNLLIKDIYWSKL